MTALTLCHHRRVWDRCVICAEWPELPQPPEGMHWTVSWCGVCSRERADCERLYALDTERGVPGAHQFTPSLARDRSTKP